ncbi:MAG: hypothetical protein ACI4JS_06830 [Oscillospiraceae bacterium]
MDNLEELLRALAEDDDEPNETQSAAENTSSENNAQSGGLFSGLDPEMLIKLFGLFETLNQPDDNERFLLALKPLLREENRAKIDSTLRLMKLLSLLPLLKNSGLLDNLGKLL